MDFTTWLALGSGGLSILAFFLRQHREIKELKSELKETRAQVRRQEKLILEFAKELNEKVGLPHKPIQAASARSEAAQVGATRSNAAAKE